MNVRVADEVKEIMRIWIMEGFVGILTFTMSEMGSTGGLEPRNDII